MSKDGDWILREDPAALDHVLGVLADRGARYRFSAPFDVRWMAGGWSSHFEFRANGYRVRTDFVTRPPRLSPESVRRIFAENPSEIPFLDAPRLALVKRTNREKDYAVIGELARVMKDPADRLLHSRSARDLVALAAANPELARSLAAERPLLASLDRGREAIEIALDAERRALMRSNEDRLARYASAAREWMAAWPDAERAITGRPLREAHRELARRAEGVLPFRPDEVRS